MTAAEASAVSAGERNWFVLVDGRWSPGGDGPPLELIAGLWPVDEQGELDRFRPNPYYRNDEVEVPTDPVDMVLWGLPSGETSSQLLRERLRGSLLDVAMNGDGRPLVVRAGDDTPCTVVATSEPYRELVYTPEWLLVGLEGLVEMLADGVDVLFNPSGPAPVRLSGDFVRETLFLLGEEQPDEDGTTREPEEWERYGFSVVEWDPEAQIVPVRIANATA